MRAGEPGSDSRPAVAAEGLGAVAGHRGDGPVGRYLADAAAKIVIHCVYEVEVAGGVYGES